MTNEDWLALLKLGAQGAGVAGGMGAFGTGAAGAIPTGDTLSGPGALSSGAIAPPPEGFGTGAPFGQAMPGMQPPTSPMSPPPPPTPVVPSTPAPQRNLGLPTPPVSPALTPEDMKFIASTQYPPGSPAATPQSMLTADAVNVQGATEPRSWWQRNISDPASAAWDKAWKEDPKTGISPAQKTLAGLGTSAGSAATSAASSKTPAAAPAGSVYKPTPINAAQMALSREQQLELLRRRAQLRTPWLNRFQPEQRSAGLMG